MPMREEKAKIGRRTAAWGGKFANWVADKRSAIYYQA